MDNKTLKEYLEELSKKDVRLIEISRAKRKLNNITDFNELTEGLEGFSRPQLLYIKSNLSEKSIMSLLMQYTSYVFTLGVGILIEKKTDDFMDALALLVFMIIVSFVIFMAIKLDRNRRNNFRHKLIIDDLITLAIEEKKHNMDDSSKKKN